MKWAHRRGAIKNLSQPVKTVASAALCSRGVQMNRIGKSGVE